MRSGTLLLPDTGPEFFSALNFAAIYSETVHTFTFTNSKSVDEVETHLDFFSRLFLSDDATHRLEAELQDRKQSVTEESGSASELDDYDRFMLFPEQNAALLKMARDEGVLVSVSENALKMLCDNEKEVRGSLEGFMKSLPSILTPELANSLLSGFDDVHRNAPPSCFLLIEEFLLCFLALAEVEGMLPEDTTAEELENNEEFLRHAAFFMYLLFGCAYCVSNDLTPLTWQPDMHRLIASMSHAIRKGDTSINALLSTQQEIPSRLGELVLKEFAPNVSTMPFDDILRLRTKRKSEIEAFRSSLAEVSSGIDPRLDADSLELELHKIINGVFRPALRDLHRVTNEIRKEAYRKLIRPDKEVGFELIPMAITVSAGLPLEYSAASAALPLFSKLYDFTIRKTGEIGKVRNASPWSILLDLQKTSG